MILSRSWFAKKQERIIEKLRFFLLWGSWFLDHSNSMLYAPVELRSVPLWVFPYSSTCLPTLFFTFCRTFKNGNANQTGKSSYKWSHPWKVLPLSRACTNATASRRTRVLFISLPASSAAPRLLYVTRYKVAAQSNQFPFTKIPDCELINY